MTQSNGTPRTIKPESRDQADPPDPADPPCLTAALYYLGLGLAPIPLCDPRHAGPCGRWHPRDCERPGKRPLLSNWPQFAKKPPTEADVRDWWLAWPLANVGLVMGGIGRLVAWDIDDEQGNDLVARYFDGPPPPTWEFVTGGGGRRLFFRWPTMAPIPTRHLRTFGKRLTFLGEGSQTVMPPSPHVSGGRYLWLPGRAPDELAIAEVPVRMRDMILSGADQKRLPGGDSKRAGARGPSASWERRAKAYCDACSPAISKEGGHSQTLKVATGLARIDGATEDLVLQALAEYYNPRCKPEWSEEELRHKASEGWKARDRVFTRNGHAPAPPAAAPDRPAVADMAARDRGVPGAPDQLAAEATSCRNDPAPPAPPAAPDQAPDDPRRHVERASAIAVRGVTWFFAPYVPRGMLTLVAGAPGTGKSSLVAYLLAKATRAVFLPGYEEEFPVMTLPRLIAHGVNLDNVFVLRRGNWVLPTYRDRLIQVVLAEKADLIVWDPISSYMPDGASENDSAFVRPFLEAAQYVGEQTGAAAVGVRHPGKDPLNVLRGSAAWREVGRSVVELQRDPGPPERRTISLFKDGLGQGDCCRAFDLVGLPGKPRVFTLGFAVSQAEAELAKVAPGDVIERGKIEETVIFLEGFLADGEKERKDVLAAAQKEGLNDRNVRHAYKRMGLGCRREGQGANHRSFWFLPASNDAGTAPG